MALVQGDASITRNFRWNEFSGWERANAEELVRLTALVNLILQPLRDVAGPIHISRGGWLYSRDGVTRRTGPHGQGAAVDFVPGDVRMEDAWRWLGSQFHADPVRYGELLLEVDHIHVTLPGFGGWGETLRELPDGTFAAEDPSTWGPPADWAVALELQYEQAAGARWGILALVAAVTLTRGA